MFFGERGPRAVRVRAPPETLRPQQPHGAAESGDVLEAHVPAAVPDRGVAAVRAATEPGPCRSRDRANVDAFDTNGASIRPAEAMNGAIKTARRIARGFRNFPNYCQ
ncbi:hypothetical protein E5206_04205 [Arthrobacter sp. PAMC25564]|nr:hypothetical protein E5206_04205 [Arthrobacter sp. PAMC25564]